MHQKYKLTVNMNEGDTYNKSINNILCNSKQ